MTLQKKHVFLSAIVLMVTTAFSSVVRADEVDDYLVQIMEKKKIPGLQLAVIKNNKIVKTAYYGIANVEKKLPVSEQTPFPINSMTKAFTGVAIMQLVSQNKLSLSDEISKHLPNLPATWQSLTIKQLLTHTSGLPEIMSGQLVELIGDGTADSAWETVQTLPMEFKANSQFKYNQTGYILLGKLIDKISGQRFVDVISKHQLQPAKMVVTEGASFSNSNEETQPKAIQYFYQTSEQQQPDSLDLSFPPFLGTAAGMSSTAIELAQYVIAMQQDKLLDAKRRKELWSPAVLDNGKTSGFSELENGYAMGWQVVGREKHPAVSATGAGASTLIIYPEDGVAIIVLTNLLGSSPINFVDQIASFYIPGMISGDK